MGGDGTGDDGRDRLIAALTQRGDALRPSEDLVNRALRRCVRHQLRFAKKKPPSAVDSPAAIAPTLIPSYPPDERPTSQDAPLERRADAPPSPPVPAATAMAATMPDDPTPAPGTGRPPGASSASRQALLAPGREIAGYRIEALIGSGGMGQVYRALQISMNRLVALKILSPRLAANPRFRERFLREARAAGRLHHPNLIAVHDVGEADGMMFFSMEIVDGSSVKEVINELGSLPEDRALDIVRQVLRALRYAHEQGIVHRDIKPDNLMLTTTGLVKVADLGLSKVDGPLEDSFTTQAGTMMGTPYYMPPEQGRDAHRADARADLYAVGASLYHMVCGKVPFEGETPVAILINASTQALSFPEPGPSAGLRRIIEALMAKKPADRPRSSVEALSLIDRATSSPFPSSATVPAARHSERLKSARVSNRQPAYSTRARRRTRRSSLVAAVIVAGALVAVAGAFALGRDDVGARARRMADEHHYQDALDEIARNRRGDAGALRALAEDIARDWDAWAEPRSQDALALIDAALKAGDASAAQRAIDDVPESLRSARVRAALAERAARAARLASGPRGDGAEAAIRRWWHDALAGVAGVAADGAFVGDGQADLGELPRAGDRVLPVALRVRLVGGRSGASEGWSLALGSGRRVSVRTGALLLQDGSGPARALATPDRDGWIGFTLARDADGWLLRVGAAAHHLPDSAEAHASLTWTLPSERRAEVTVGADR